MGWNRQMHLSVRSGEQCASGIVYIDFDQQGAGGHINGFGRPDQFSAKLAPGKFGQAEICRHSVLHPLRVFLRNVYVNAQLSGLSDVKKIGLRSSTASRINQIADVGIARGNDAIKRRVDFFERYQCGVLLHGRLVGFDDCFVRVVRADRVIDVLLSNSVALQKSLIAGLGNGSELEICLRGEQIAASLLQLLIDFRRFDDGKQLPLLNARADIEIPPLQVAVCTSINR